MAERKYHNHTEAPVIFWVAGTLSHPGYRRLSLILGQVLPYFKQATIRPYRAGGFEDGAGAINIWLSSEVDDFAPTQGVNIIWFLDQMKLMTRATLESYDAVMTSSATHLQFLRSLLNPAMFVGLCKCPVKAVDHINGDVMGPITTMSLDLGASELAELDYDQITSLDDVWTTLDKSRAFAMKLSVRERMCGFEPFEELCALSAGIPVVTDQRQGIPTNPLRFLTTLAKDGVAALTTDKTATALAHKHDVQGSNPAFLSGDHEPQQVAQALLSAINVAVDKKETTTRVRQSPKQNYDAGPLLFVDDLRVAKALQNTFKFSVKDSIGPLAGHLMHLPMQTTDGLPDQAQQTLYCLLIDTLRSTDMTESTIFFDLARRYFARQAVYDFAKGGADMSLSLSLLKPGTDVSDAVLAAAKNHSAGDKTPPINDWTQPLVQVSNQISSSTDQHQAGIILSENNVFSAVDPSIQTADIANMGLPWTSVLTATNDETRVHKMLSWRLNDHNTYDFISRLGTQKTLSPFLTAPQPENRSPIPKYAVFIHAFYLDELSKLFLSCGAIFEHVPLYISTDTAEKRAAIIEILNSAKLTAQKVDVVKNVGRDIYPKLVHFAQDHDDHEFVLHLHTKKSPHSKSLKNWSNSLFTSLAGSPERVAHILRAFKTEPTLGMVYPDPPALIRPAMAWTRNRQIASHLADKLGLSDLPSSADLEFPAGSMFWARTAALAPLLNLDLSHQDFPPEDGQEDGTLAHAIERMLGVIVKHGGFKMARATEDI